MNEISRIYFKTQIYEPHFFIQFIVYPYKIKGKLKKIYLIYKNIIFIPLLLYFLRKNLFQKGIQNKPTFFFLLFMTI